MWNDTFTGKTIHAQEHYGLTTVGWAARGRGVPQILRVASEKRSPSDVLSTPHPPAGLGGLGWADEGHRLPQRPRASRNGLDRARCVAPFIPRQARRVVSGYRSLILILPESSSLSFASTSPREAHPSTHKSKKIMYM